MGAPRRRLSIVAMIDDIDLRTVKAQSAYLRRMAKAYNLEPYECICLTNVARTRFRLIFRTNGGPGAVFLCIPEIDQKSKYSVYLRVSEALAALTGIDSIRLKFDELCDFTEERIVRSNRYKRARKKRSRSR